MMASPLEHQMTVESPTNGQPPAAAAAATSAERDSLPQLRNGRWIALGADASLDAAHAALAEPRGRDAERCAPVDPDAIVFTTPPLPDRLR